MDHTHGGIGNKMGLTVAAANPGYVATSGYAGGAPAQYGSVSSQLDAGGGYGGVHNTAASARYQSSGGHVSFIHRRS